MFKGEGSEALQRAHAAAQMSPKQQLCRRQARGPAPSAPAPDWQRRESGRVFAEGWRGGQEATPRVWGASLTLGAGVRRPEACSEAVCVPPGVAYAPLVMLREERGLREVLR